MNIIIAKKVVVFLSATLLVCLPISTVAETTELIARGSIAADAVDKAGETVGAIGSGLAYEPKENVVFAISDRGPGDGTIDYCPRFDVLRVTQSSEKAKLNIEVIKTVLLHDREGKEMTGLAPEISDKPVPQLRDGRVCIDPEAIAIAPDGTLYISDEYVPMLYQFDREGKMIRFIAPPANYLPRNSEGKIDFASKELASGRVSNHGFEGMALSPDGKQATLILQNGLTQDGGKNARLTRMLVVDLVSGQPVAEYAYEFPEAEKMQLNRGQKKHNRVKQNDLSISELTTLDASRLLSLERDNFGANGATDFKTPVYKCIFLVDAGQATNLFSIPGRPYDQLPGTANFQALSPNEKVKPVTKKLVVNFAEPPAPLPPNEFAAKWEGIALLPGSKPGQRQMMLACDNDFLNPTLRIKGHDVPFPRAKQSVPTTFLLFDLHLP